MSATQLAAERHKPGGGVGRKEMAQQALPDPPAPAIGNSRQSLWAGRATTGRTDPSEGAVVCAICALTF